MNAYVRLDEVENAVVSLEFVAWLLPKCEGGSTMWKWALIGAHDAAQAALVCEVADSTGTSVLDKRSAAAMLEWLQSTSEDPPRERLADFLTLVSRAPFRLDADLSKDIEKLHQLRNSLVHFTPKSWSIEVAGLPGIVAGACGLAAALLFNGKAQIRMTKGQVARLNQSIVRIGQLTGEISA